MRRTSSDIEQIACDLYSEGVSSNAIGAQLNLDPTTILNILKRHETQRRNASESHRKHTVIHRCFENVSTELGAYLIGFIAADGCVRNHPPKVMLSVAAVDEEVVRWFRSYAGSTQKISTHKGSGHNPNCTMAMVSIVSAQIVHDLKGKGIHQNKTFTCQPWRNVPKNLERHYWRGAIDGDGTVWIGAKRSRMFGTIEFAGTLAMVSGLRDAARRETGHTMRIRQDRNIWRASASWSAGHDIVKWLYSDVQYALTRKLFIANGIISNAPQRRNAIGRVIVANGTSRRLYEWAADSCATESAISYRLKSGWSAHDAVSVPVKKSDRGGIKRGRVHDSLSGWARRTGLTKQCIWKRLKRGWSVSDALSTRN